MTVIAVSTRYMADSHGPIRSDGGRKQTI